MGGWVGGRAMVHADYLVVTHTHPHAHPHAHPRPTHAQPTPNPRPTHAQPTLTPLAHFGPRSPAHCTRHTPRHASPRLASRPGPAEMGALTRQVSSMRIVAAGTDPLGLSDLNLEEVERSRRGAGGGSRASMRGGEGGFSRTRSARMSLARKKDLLTTLESGSKEGDEPVTPTPMDNRAGREGAREGRVPECHAPKINPKLFFLVFFVNPRSFKRIVTTENTIHVLNYDNSTPSLPTTDVSKPCIRLQGSAFRSEARVTVEGGGAPASAPHRASRFASRSWARALIRRQASSTGDTTDLAQCCQRTARSTRWRS